MICNRGIKTTNTLKQIFIKEFGEALGELVYNKAKPLIHNWLQQKQKESEYPCWAKTITEEYLKEFKEKKVNA